MQADNLGLTSEVYVEEIDMSSSNNWLLEKNNNDDKAKMEFSRRRKTDGFSINKLNFIDSASQANLTAEYKSSIEGMKLQTNDAQDVAEELKVAGFSFDLIELNFFLRLFNLLQLTKQSIHELHRVIAITSAYQKDWLIRRSKQAMLRLESTRMKQMMLKISFFVLFFNVVISSFWLSKFPEYYYLWHTFKMVVLFGIRIVVFKFKKLHYYLFDCCYYLHALLLLHIWVLPRSWILWKAIFGFNGLLGFSIYLFRDAIIPHSLDRMTSAEVHLSPLLLTWTMRWFPSPAFVPLTSFCNSYFGCLRLLFLASFPFYCIWSFLYYTKMFVVSSCKIEKRNYSTLYRYMAIEQGNLNRLPVKLQRYGKFVFMIGHAFLFALGLFFAPLLTNSFLWHTVFIFVALGTQIYNGVIFYLKLSAKHQEVRQLARNV